MKSNIISIKLSKLSAIYIYIPLLFIPFINNSLSELLSFQQFKSISNFKINNSRRILYEN
jgi:hypothetical protein